MKNRLNQMVQRALTGFAAGIVVPLLPYLLSFAAGGKMDIAEREQEAPGNEAEWNVLAFMEE